jgi:hypothetical protein
MLVNDRKVEYRRLGKSGLRVSVPILGAMSFGSDTWAPWVINENEVILTFLMFPRLRRHRRLPFKRQLLTQVSHLGISAAGGGMESWSYHVGYGERLLKWRFGKDHRQSLEEG